MTQEHENHPERVTPGPPPGPLLVAVTGGIGAGKSTVSAALAGRGAVVIDSDRLAREVVEPGSEGLAEVVERFGPGVLTGDGALDRRALGAIVFTDAAARADLERITHPRVRALFADRAAAAPADGVVVNDIPLVRTARDAVRYHLVVGVGVADETERVRRLVDRGHTEQDARARIAAQLDDDRRRALTDVWLDNSGSPDQVRPAVATLWERLVAFAQARRSGVPAAGAARPPAVLVARVADAVGAPVAADDDGLRTGRVPAEAVSRLAAAGFVAVAASGSGGRWANTDPGCPVVLREEG